MFDQNEKELLEYTLRLNFHLDQTDLTIKQYTLRLTFHLDQTHLTEAIGLRIKQARKSSEDAQAAVYARFEKGWAM